MYEAIRELHRNLSDDEKRAVVAQMKQTLQHWLDDNQRVDERRLAEIVATLNGIWERVHEFGEVTKESPLYDLNGVLQTLNELVGCLHMDDGLEVSSDDEGLYVLCSRCYMATRDLKTWEKYAR
jgi:hypothetical protein